MVDFINSECSFRKTLCNIVRKYNRNLCSSYINMSRYNCTSQLRLEHRHQKLFIIKCIELIFFSSAVISNIREMMTVKCEYFVVFFIVFIQTGIGCVLRVFFCLFFFHLLNLSILSCVFFFIFVDVILKVI